MWEFVIFVVVMIVISLVGKAKQQSTKSDGTPNPRVQKLVERIQAQQGFNQPIEIRGKFTPAQPPQTVLPVGPPYPAPVQQQPPSTWLPSYQPRGHRPPQNHLPTPKADTDSRVRELMKAGNEVAAIRLLCDEQDMGILDAQKYARALVAPPGTNPASAQYKPAAEPSPEPAEEDTRYVGSAAFAESIFDLDREEDTWASGWVDTPEPEDRSDIDELWQTVRNPPRPSN